LHSPKENSHFIPVFSSLLSLHYNIRLRYERKHLSQGFIHYCDPLVRRCHLTSRCRNYESTGNLSPEQLDINNEAFWQNLSSNFKGTLKLLKKAAQKYGIDLSKPLTDEEEEQHKINERLLDTKDKTTSAC
jgi:hypothetical protein